MDFLPNIEQIYIDFLPDIEYNKGACRRAARKRGIFSCRHVETQNNPCHYKT